MGGQGSGRHRIYPSSPITNLDALFRIGKERGYPTRAKLSEFLASKCKYTKNPRLYYLKMSKCAFSYGDILMISDALEMTASEFVEVWFPNCFVVEDGVARVRLTEDVKEIIWTRRWNNELQSRRAVETRKAKEKQATSEIADFLKNFK